MVNGAQIMHQIMKGVNMTIVKNCDHYRGYNNVIEKGFEKNHSKLI